MLTPYHLGPVNTGPMAILAIALLITISLSLRNVHRGRNISLTAVGITLMLPIVFAAWASTWQHDHAMAWAQSVSPEWQHTQMAHVLSRAIATQIYAGLTTVVGGLGLLVGAVALTVRGERPRWMVGGVAAGLAVVLVGVAAVSMSAYPAIITAIRVGTYTVVAAIAVAALVSAHRRGPGIQLATMLAVVLPLVVVGADLATLGSIATVRLTEVAQAPVGAKGPLMAAAVATLDSIQGSAWIGLTLAAGLSLLGPLVAWRRDRPHAASTAIALLAVVAVAALGLSWTMHWTLPLRW